MEADGRRPVKTPAPGSLAPRRERHVGGPAKTVLSIAAMADFALPPSLEQDYVTDVPYVRTFSNSLSPSMLRLAAALNGFAPPPNREFTYLELGSANGDSLVALASAFPDARFVGIDINHDHVAFATSLAAKACVDNVLFIQGDFAELPRDALPDFDFVAMYGLLSWISPDKRKAAIDLAATRLKPGGLLFAAYNAMPGWSAVEPLRRLMLDAAGTTGTSAERAQRGLSAAKLLDDAGARYFVQNPAARAMLAAALRTGLPYAIHEYFLPDWHPHYFEDLADELDSAGLHFVGQLPAYLNFRDLAIPASLQPVFAGLTHRIAFERAKDYALNEFFRRDVFIKGQVSRADELTREYFDTTRFTSLVDPSRVKGKVRLPSCTLEFVGPIFESLIPAVAEHALSVPELARLPDLAPFGIESIRRAVLQLTIGEQLWPLHSPVPPLLPAGLGPFLPCHPHARFALEQPLSAGDRVVVASPATGTGIVLSPLEVVCLRALAIPHENRIPWLRAFATAHPLKLEQEGRPIDDPVAQVETVARELEQFRRLRVPKLVQLGILAPSAPVD